MTGQLLYINFNRYKLNMWDIGGQKSLRSYWRNYFEQTDGITPKFHSKTMNVFV